MRFWVTKNSELSVREQLVHQVVLGILSLDLPPGHKLPSTRAMARRYKIHANTVSAAYHHLLEEGWVELRRGSGVYVREQAATEDDDLERLLGQLLRGAQELGHQPADVLQRLQAIVHPARYVGVTVSEPEPAMREILCAEIGIKETTEGPGILVAALQTRIPSLRRSLKPGTPVFALRLRSIPGSLEGQPRPGPETILSIVSASDDFRRWARIMLIAVGINPDCLCDVDSAIEGWQQRASATTFAITDVVAARVLPPNCPHRVFRVISDASLAELRRIAPCDAAT